MQSYSVRDVERVLRLSRSTIQGLIKGGFVKPTRGPRRQYCFSFQDLIVLRTARALEQAKVPRRRIRRSLDDLRQHLPETAPLSGLSIRAIGDRVVVRDGKAHWQVDDRSVRARARSERRSRRAAGGGTARARSASPLKSDETGSVKAWSSRAPIRVRRRKRTSARSATILATPPPGSTGDVCCTNRAARARRSRCISVRSAPVDQIRC